MKKIKHLNHRRSLFFLFALCSFLLLSACSGNSHMYQHKRSDCDCPRFD